MSKFLILDIASAPIPEAESLLADEPIEVPENYKKPGSRAAYVDKERTARLDKAGLDLDLARITGIGYLSEDDTDPTVLLISEGEEQERQALGVVASMLRERPSPTIVTYNGHRFDLPLLMRRAKYLSVDFPEVNIDRYRSSNIDLFARLTMNGTVRGRSLQFYAKRLGWTDLVKPLSGAEESKVPISGQWTELRDSLRHDVLAVKRLAQWLGVMPPEKELANGPVDVPLF